MKMEGQIATLTGPDMYCNSQIVSSASLKLFFSKERTVVDLFLIITILWWLLKLLLNLLGLLLKIPVIRELMNSYLGKVKKKVSDFVKKTMEEQFLSYFLYGFKLEELKKSVENLQEKRDRIQHLVDDEYRNSKDTANYVSKWLDDTDGIITDYDNFRQDEHLPYTMCYLPKPWLRYRLAKKAYSLARKVNKFCKYSFSDGLSSGQRPMSIDFLLSVVNFETFNSRKQVTQNITKALKDATIKMVGVYGMGGVGKTTLVKEVASITRRDKLFDVVIFATVTRNPDIKQIQGQLADQLGARLNEETEIGRASRLRDIFKKEKKNTLVILDDLWAKLDLNKLGIPLEEGGSVDGQTTNGATGDSNTLKILLTSRSKEVVFDKMHVRENSGFIIEGLKDQEAMVLFKKMVGMVDKPPTFGPLAVKISNKCGGLPIAIVTIGKTLRTKSYLQWKETLGQLERQEFTEVAESVDFSTRLSFNYLENEELKSTFLLCAQLGYHPLIMDLVKYCIGVGIFEGFLTIRETHEKVLRLIKKLKDSSLLLDSYSDDRFNMHDMIQESALSIAFEERDLFTMRNGKLKEWPRENKFVKYSGISICNCDIIDKLPNSVSCPRLEVFHVDSHNPSFSIPEDFFQQAKQLRALILTGIDVSNFCASIGCLTNLRMLCLEKCRLGDISFIGKLEKLRILSLSGSRIENLSIELGKLHKLQLLDISNCTELREIPPNVLSSLNSLEELYMRNSVKWESEENQRENSVLTELRHLHQLKNLDINLPSAAVLPRNLFLNNLDSYKIVIGDFQTFSLWDLKMPVKDEASRFLALQIKEPNVIHYQEGVKMLFRGVEKMYLGELKGVTNIFYELNLEGFPCLKELCIIENSDIECIIDPKNLLNLNDVFPILESLCLYQLDNMMEIISHNANLRVTSFSRLKVVRIHDCGYLENAFSRSMVPLFKNLETIDISYCKTMKAIVFKEEHDETKINFPKLRSLALKHLHNFIGFYSNDGGQNDYIILFKEEVEIPNLESLDLSSMNMKEISSQPKPFENLTKLNVKYCHRLQYLFSFSMAKSMKKLKCLSISYCDQMVEIFKYEIEDMQEAQKVRVFPKLEEIHLYRMKSLTTVWPRESSPDSFTSLNYTFIGWCSQLVTVLPSHMVGRFGRLESLRIVGCYSVEQIFDLNGGMKSSVGDETHLQVLQIDYLKKLKRIWDGDPEGILNFKRLQSVEVTECHELEYLFPVSVAKSLHELDYLSVSDCRQMEEIALGDEGLNEYFEFPQVSVVEMERLPKLKCFSKGTHRIEWPKLKKLSVFGCDQLEAFKTETLDSKGGPIFLPEEIIPNLETMEMNLKEVEKLKLCIKNYRMNHMKNFLVLSCPSIEILYQFLYRMPYLERLTLVQCDLIELMPIQDNIGTVLQLKYLNLMNLNALENIGFERRPALQYCLKHLYIKSCKKLIKLAPSSVSLTHLTTIEVHGCWRMKNLMEFSTAKSLVQLVSLKVIRCAVLETIVAIQNDEVELTYQHEIVFSKLTTLELKDLPNLSCFYSFEIRDSFEFPSLEKLIVNNCPRMTKFCNRVCTAPNLQVIEIDKEEEDWSWKGDLNERILKMFMMRSLRNFIHLSLFDYAELAYDIWHGKILLPKHGFEDLETLVVENCEFLSIVIPSHLFLYLPRLEELEVRSCSLVEAIFDVNDMVNVKSSKLRSITLDNLPNMRHVWSKNPEEILSFEYLEEVEVTDCDRVQTVFPAASMIKSLTTLKIINCGQLEEIVGKVEAYEEGAVEEFEFPNLESLSLGMLPKLKSGSMKLRCPSLAFLTAYHCHEFTKLQIFASEIQSYQGANVEDQICISNVSQPFFSLQQVLYLEELSLTKKEAILLCNGAILADDFSELIYLKLHCFHNVSEADTLPFEILHKLPKVQILSVDCSDFSEIFSQTLGPGIVNQLKLTELRLEFLHKLDCIGIEHPCMNALQKKLKYLYVERCPRLVKLVQSPVVSFSNLKTITITKCHGLECLFTTRTARGLPNLRELVVLECESIEEIVVAHEEDDVMDCDVDDIIFESLQEMKLNSLPRLACFYAGTCTLNFPKMWNVQIDQCPNMNFFSQGLVGLPRLKVHIPPCLMGNYWQYRERIHFSTSLATTGIS